MKDHKNNKPGQMDKNKKPMSKEESTQQSNKNNKTDKNYEDPDSKNERKLSPRH